MPPPCAHSQTHHDWERDQTGIASFSDFQYTENEANIVHTVIYVLAMYGHNIKLRQRERSGKDHDESEHCGKSENTACAMFIRLIFAKVSTSKRGERPWSQYGLNWVCFVPSSKIWLHWHEPIPLNPHPHPNGPLRRAAPMTSGDQRYM